MTTHKTRHICRECHRASLWAMVAMAVLATLSGWSAAQTMTSAISYQGRLMDGGQPANGTYDLQFTLYSVESGGSALATVERDAVTVQDGRFTTSLDFGAEAFDGSRRWLQISVQATGSGQGFSVLAPRQELLASPYALRALRSDEADTALSAEMADHAETADHAVIADHASTADQADTADEATLAQGMPWNGLTDIPAGVLEGSKFAQTLVVAKAGGDFTSVRAALNSITDASDTKKYLVWVAPGVYEEPGGCVVKNHIHLSGAGRSVSIITAARSDTDQTVNAATLSVENGGNVSDLTIRNTGTGTYSMAILCAGASSVTILEDLYAVANGAGGVYHYGIYVRNGSPTILNSKFEARGVPNVYDNINAAFACVSNDIDAFVSAPTVKNCEFFGVGTRTGYAMMMGYSSPTIFDSIMLGDFRGLVTIYYGTPVIYDSVLRVSNVTNAYLFETSNSVVVFNINTGLYYGLNLLAPGSLSTSIRAVFCHGGGYEPLDQYGN